MSRGARNRVCQSPSRKMQIVRPVAAYLGDSITLRDCSSDSDAFACLSKSSTCSVNSIGEPTAMQFLRSADSPLTNSFCALSQSGRRCEMLTNEYWQSECQSLPYQPHLQTAGCWHQACCTREFVIPDLVDLIWLRPSRVGDIFLDQHAERAIGTNKRLLGRRNLLIFDHCGDLNYLVRSWGRLMEMLFVWQQPIRSSSIELTLLSFNRNDGDLAPNEATTWAS